MGALRHHRFDPEYRSERQEVRFAGSQWTLRWREVDSNHPFRRERDGPEERPAADHRRPRDNLRLSVSVRDLLSPTAERPFARAGPMVRIHFPPAKSRANSGTDLEGRRVTPMRPMADSRRGAAAGQLRREPWRTKMPRPSRSSGPESAAFTSGRIGAGFKLRLQDIDERDILRLNGDTLA